MAPTLSEFDLEVVYWARVKYHTSDTISHISTTVMFKSFPEYNVPVLMMAEAQAEDVNTERNTRIWHSLPYNDGMNPVNSALPDVLQRSDVTASDKLLMTCGFVTAQMTDPYYMEFATTVGKPGSVYS